MFKRLYDWTLSLAESRHSTWALAGIAFAESSFFPLPPDLILLPMSLAKPQKAWFYAGVCTLASVLGGMLGYAIGALLFDTIGHWIIQLYGYGPRIDALRDFYAQWGWAFILVKGLTPIPFKLVTIVSGLLGYNFALFVAAGRAHPRRALLHRRGGDESLRRFFPRLAGKTFRRCSSSGCWRSSSAASGPPRIWSEPCRTCRRFARSVDLCRSLARAAAWRRRRSPAPGPFSRWASSLANCA